MPVSLSFDLRSILSHSSVTDYMLATDSVANLRFEKGRFNVADIHKCSFDIIIDGSVFQMVWRMT